MHKMTPEMTLKLWLNSYAIALNHIDWTNVEKVMNQNSLVAASN